jgi:hypothetical protein
VPTSGSGWRVAWSSQYGDIVIDGVGAGENSITS